MYGFTGVRIRPTVPQLSLVCILGAAVALRACGVTANLPDYPAWDEPNIVERAFAVGGGHLNPHFFRWPGTLLIYANAFLFAAYYAVGHVVGWFHSLREFQRAYQTDPTAFYVLARFLNIGTAAATVSLIFLITRQLGLLAAATAGLLIAVSPLHVAESAVAYTDVPATLLLTAALITIVPFAEKPRLRNFVLSGLLLGLGTAIKYYVVAGAAGIACAAMLSPVPRLRRIQWLTIAGASAVVGFLLGCPFIVFAYPEFSADFAFQLTHQSTGHLGFEPVGNPVVWYVRRSLLPAVGLPALLGAGYGVVAIVRRHRRYLPLIVAGVVYFAFATLSHVSFQRYAVPHVAVVAIAAAAAVSTLGTAPFLSWLAAASIVAVPAWGAVGVAVERQKEDVRVVAARWLEANIGPSRRVLSYYDGPRFPATLQLSQYNPISDKQFDIVESGRIDVFVLMSGTVKQIQEEPALRNHAEVAESHLRLYDWVRQHAALVATFRKDSEHRGGDVEIYVTSSAPRQAGH